jgi:hypothetical protein
VASSIKTAEHNPKAEAAAWAQLAMTFDYDRDTEIHAARIGLLNLSDMETDVHALTFLGVFRRAFIEAVITILEEPKHLKEPDEPSPLAGTSQPAFGLV